MSDDRSSQRPVWQTPQRRWVPGRLPWLMGILNVTPDSFSDGGRFRLLDAAVAQGLQLAADGADVIDIGGESTRPGADPVSVAEELDRVVPVIRRLSRELSVPISIDTMKADVAAAALDAGATIVNDVSAGRFDPRMSGVCAASECGVILMHMRGTPQTMQQAAYYDDIVADVLRELGERLREFVAAGVNEQRIMLDPGIGFAKAAEHNVSLLANVSALHSLGRPLLIGHSRKRFLYKLLGRETDERLAGTIGVAIALAEQGCEMLRVHDVAAVRDALRAWDAIAAPGTR
jgi:dihydropteroate synthase